MLILLLGMAAAVHAASDPAPAERLVPLLAVFQLPTKAESRARLKALLDAPSPTTEDLANFAPVLKNLESLHFSVEQLAMLSLSKDPENRRAATGLLDQALGEAELTAKMSGEQADDASAAALALPDDQASIEPLRDAADDCAANLKSYRYYLEPKEIEAREKTRLKILAKLVPLKAVRAGAPRRQDLPADARIQRGADQAEADEILRWTDAVVGRKPSSY